MQGPEAFISVEMGCEGRLENSPIGSFMEVPSLFLPFGWGGSAGATGQPGQEDWMPGLPA